MPSKASSRCLCLAGGLFVISYIAISVISRIGVDTRVSSILSRFSINNNTLLEKSSPVLAPVDRLTAVELFRRLFDYIEEPSLCCRKLLQYGGVQFHDGQIDGDKFVCQDQPYTLQAGQCLVYSFGIANEWSFDNQMAALGCQVHSFDPSMQWYDPDEVHVNVTFHKIGLAARDLVLPNGWRLQSLETIRARLGHTARPIDYLKIDVEGSEWDILSGVSAATLHSVRQLGMEVHMNKTEAQFRRYYTVLGLLHAAGFRSVSSHVNRVDRRRLRLPGVDRLVGTLHEMVWVNIHHRLHHH